MLGFAELPLTQIREALCRPNARRIPPAELRCDAPPEHSMVDFSVIRRHARRGKALLKPAADRVPIQRQQLRNNLHSLINTGDDASGQPVLHDLRDRSTIKRKHRRPARHGLDYNKAEGFWPIDRKNQPCRLTEKLTFIALVYLADKLDVASVHERCDYIAKVCFINLVDLRCNLEWKASCTRNGNGTVRSFLGRNAAEERKIEVAPLAYHFMKIEREPVIDGTDEVRVGKRCSLRVGYGN